ncbi:MAG: hypothetical protein ACRC8S_05340 [Fimbriiglobus sp.]
MRRYRLLGLSLLAWFAVWAFWLIVTRDFHPTLDHALVVTTSLIVAYAIAAYIHHLVLIPKLRVKGFQARYLGVLIVMMLLLNAIALAILRTAYIAWSGPDPDPNGVYKHYLIDLFGMAVHLVIAALLVRVARKFSR